MRAMNALSTEPKNSARRTAETLLTLSALGEIVVGLLVALLPVAVSSLLLAAPVEGTGVVATRLVGVAFAAQGIAWWLDRKQLEPKRLRQVAVGYIAFNLGIGLVFLIYSAMAGRFLPMPWLVSAVHLLLGGTFAVVAYRAQPAVGY